MKLLMTCHLDVLERQQFTENPIAITEVSDLISEYFKTEQVFPGPAKSEGAVFEGHYIEKTKDGYKLCWQRHSPLNSFHSVEKQEEVYNDFDELIRDYIKKEYKFNIDGLKIVV